MRQLPIAIAVTESDLRVAAEIVVDTGTDAVVRHRQVEADRCDALRCIRGIVVGAGAGTICWIAFGLCALVTWGWLGGR